MAGRREVGAFRRVLPNQAVGVFVGAALTGSGVASAAAEVEGMMGGVAEITAQVQGGFLSEADGLDAIYETMEAIDLILGVN